MYILYIYVTFIAELLPLFITLPMKNLLSHRLYFNSYDKEWLIFIHGVGGNSTTFHMQLKAFKAHFNILMPDLRGHGLSQGLAEPENSKYSLDLISEDVFRLMDHLQIKKSNFIGCSFGASLIRIMESSQPERFKSIVMTGAVLRIKTSMYLIFKLGKLLSPYINNHLLYTIVAYIIMPYSNHKESRRMFIEGSKLIARNEYRSWLGILDEIKHRMDELFLVSFTSDSVLLISGNEDHAFLKDCLRYCTIHQSIQLIVLQNCGHVSSIEKYDKFNNLALDFIQKEERKAGLH